MKAIKYLSILLIVTYIPDYAKCQSDTIEVPGRMVNDSLTIPVYTKGNSDLVQTITKYIYYTDTMRLESNELRVIDFWIDINRKGRIVKSHISSYYNLSDQFKKDFPKLVKEINHWQPSYEKDNNKATNRYNILFRIEIHKEAVIIRLLNSDSEKLYEQTLKRPLARSITQ